MSTAPPAGDVYSAACWRSGCNRARTEACEALEVTANGEILRVCPVCGAFGDTAFAHIDAKFTALETGALPGRGEPVAFGMEAPFDDALYAFTATYEYAGRTDAFDGLVQIALTVEIAGNFRFARVDVTETNETAERTEVRTELPFTYEDGILTFETDAAGLFLLLPRE